MTETGTALNRRDDVAAATDQLRDLERRVRELEAANADLCESAQLTAHDLKEPLATIALFAETLSSEHAEALDLPARRLLRGVQEGVERMRLTVDDTLASARRACDGPDVVDMSLVVDEALRTLDSRVRRTSARVRVEWLPSVTGDRTQLLRLMQNLLSNSLKHGHGLVTVRARPDLARWRFEVADDGPGFQPRSTKRGDGIGLAIARAIVERHGGELSLRSGPLRGTVVAFTLPAA